MSIKLAFYVKTVIVCYKFQDLFFKQRPLMNQSCYDNLVQRFTANDDVKFQGIWNKFRGALKTQRLFDEP